MTDQENNLVGCVNPGSTSKLCPDLPSINWRFVTAMAKGEPHHWASLGGDAQQGSLSTMFDGPRVDASYDPMRKQGAILLGNGGDNSNGSQGTFYEGVMTAGYPTDATDQRVQANVVAARYDVQQLSLTPASATTTPPGLQTFAPGSSQQSTVTFTNTTGAPAVGVKLSISVPDKQWTSVIPGTTDTSQTFDSVAPGASVSTTFKVTSGSAAFNGDLVGNASWTNPANGARQSVTTAEKVRNVSPIKINEFRTRTSGNPTNAFIELYNAGGSTVDLSNWTLTEHPTEQPISSAVTVPAGTTLASHRHYLLGLSSSGLAAPASAGDTSVDVSSSTGLAPGQQVQIGTGSAAETRTIAAVTNTGATGPRVAGRIGNAVKLAGNGEYVQLPEGIVSGLHDFTISAWVNPSQNSAWSRVFDFGTGTTVNMFLTLSAGGGPLRFAITTGGGGAEQRIDNTGTLPLGSWSHVAVTLSGNTGTLYVNGTPVGTNPNMTLHPSDLGATTQNYIGRSQYPDPYLNATVDDFQIYDGALSAADIGALAGGQPGAGDVASYKFDEDSGPTALDSSGNRRNATIISPPSQSTPLWQPLPDGPIITVPAGSTNVPVTSTSGFTVGQKLAIGYGDTFETATVTAVGKPGTQARLAAAAPAGATNIKVTSTANITAGDTIRLDIGPRIEHVTVASVGTSGAGGTGLTLSAPLKFSHSSNLPFSDRGTGVTFSPATRFPHSSNEPVQPLNSAITLDTPLGSSHAINTPVIDTAVTNAGYQGPPAPDQWFGGPALSASAGNMVLRDAHGLVADSLNYGSLVDPWLAEGYQGRSGAGQAGCTVTPPGTATGAGSSAVRYPDGADTDSNCTDFTTSNNPTPGTAKPPVISMSRFRCPPWSVGTGSRGDPGQRTSSTGVLSRPTQSGVSATSGARIAVTTVVAGTTRRGRRALRRSACSCRCHRPSRRSHASHWERHHLFGLLRTFTHVFCSPVSIDDSVDVSTTNDTHVVATKVGGQPKPAPTLICLAGRDVDHHRVGTRIGAIDTLREHALVLDLLRADLRQHGVGDASRTLRTLSAIGALVALRTLSALRTGVTRGAGVALVTPVTLLALHAIGTSRAVEASVTGVALVARVTLDAIEAVISAVALVTIVALLTSFALERLLPLAIRAGEAIGLSHLVCILAVLAIRAVRAILARRTGLTSHTVSAL